MTITAAGFAGTVTEAGWAGINGLLAPYADGTGWTVTPYAANGLAQVQVAAGTINGDGVRCTNDAAATLTLTAPGTGGAWYLIAARRTWSPTAAASLVAIAGTTTGSAAVPTAPPVAFPALNSTPGSVTDQPLAWAFVAAGSTTVTVWDARLVRTATGLRAPNLWALQAYTTLGTLVSGAIVQVQEFTTASGTVRPSLWRLTKSTSSTLIWRPDGIRVNVPAVLAELVALVAGMLNITMWNNTTEAYEEASGTIHRYSSTTGGFSPWSLKLTSYTPATVNWTQGNGSKAGYYWIESGVYHCKAKLTWGSTTALAGNGITIGSPLSAFDSIAGFVGSCVMRDNSATGYLPMGLTVNDSAAGTVRPIPMLSFSAANAGLNAGNAPIAFAQGDTLEMEWTCIPA